MECLSNSSLETLELAFTDNFVDAHRRLTPERRTVRTRAAVELAANSSSTSALQRIDWPVFQQDKALMPLLLAALERNYKKTKSAHNHAFRS